MNLVAKGVSPMTDVLSQVEATLDDCLTTVQAQYTGWHAHTSTHTHIVLKYFYQFTPAVHCPLSDLTCIG